MTQTFQFPAIKLAESKDGVSKEIQLFRVGTFYHSQYGKFEITPEILKAMEQNFKTRVRGVDIPVNYKHDSDSIAAGWMLDVYEKNDGKELWAEVAWTPAGEKALAEKEFKYISPEFSFEYQDNESLKKYGPVLLGAGLTNIPTIKNMEPVVLSEYKLESELDACVKDLIPELMNQGHDQDQAIAIAYSKCQKEMGMAEAMTERQKLEAARDSRSKKYGIEVTADSALTAPAGQPNDESKYGDPVNYKFPMADASQAGNARVRFKQFAANIYKADKSRALVHERIVKKELEFGVQPDFDPKDKLDALLSTEVKQKLTKSKGVKAMDYASIDVESMSPEQLKALVKDLLAKMVEMKGKSDMAEKQMADMQAEKKCAEQKAAFALMLSEGKVCKAQEEAYLAGDMVKFAELAQPVKFSEAGNAGRGSKIIIDPQEEVIRLAEIKLSEKSVKTLEDGIRAVLKEKPELTNKIYA